MEPARDFVLTLENDEPQIQLKCSVSRGYSLEWAVGFSDASEFSTAADQMDFFVNCNVTVQGHTTQMSTVIINGLECDGSISVWCVAVNNNRSRSESEKVQVIFHGTANLHCNNYAELMTGRSCHRKVATP